jgi:hypothetical protein
MQQRLSARNSDGRSATFFDCLEAFLRRKLHFQYMAGILNFAAAGAREVAAEQWFQHQDERVLLASLEFLL